MTDSPHTTEYWPLEPVVPVGGEFLMFRVHIERDPYAPSRLLMTDNRPECRYGVDTRMLSDTDAMEVRQRFVAGDTVHNIAKDFVITEASLYGLVAGKNYQFPATYLPVADATSFYFLLGAAKSKWLARIAA